MLTDKHRSALCKGVGPTRAWRLLVALALVKIGVHLVSAGLFAYGYMSDELYYFDCADRLAWGYVDHPPFSIAVLWLVRTAFGDGLIALRLVPALAGAATVVLAGLMARELGGGRVAQGLAGLAALVSPVYLGVGGFYSMNALEPALWALAAYLLLRLFNGADKRLWLAVGAVLGIGLLNKISALWFGGGLAVGVLLTPQRRWLRTPWPWLAAAIAVALFAPHVIWQVQHDWPTLEFMRSAVREKMPSKSVLVFLGEQALMMHPVVLPFWLAGLAYYFVAGAPRPYRTLGLIWLTVFVLLLASGRARSYYIAPAYSLLLPAGGVVVERLAGMRAWVPRAVAALFAAGGVVILPAAIDLLPPRSYVAYERALGLSAPTDQVGARGPMPLHFALRFGWPELARDIARVHAALPPDESAGAGILVETFGEAGAINFFGRELGLPRAVSPYNNYWLWGPGDSSGDVMIVVAAPGSPLLAVFVAVERVGPVDCAYCLPEQAAKSIWVARGIRRPLAEVWVDLKRYL